jgi:hypothetical protein
MMRDDLGSRLRRVPVPDALEARERTVAAARAAAPTRSAVPARRRAIALACAAALLGGGLATAPGRAVAGWVGELVGIGDVGGSPTKKQRDRWEKGPPVVIDNGPAPDGSRYEWVAYGCEVDMERDEGIPGLIRGFGLSLEWPGGGEGGGSCEEYESTAATERKTFTSFGVQPLPSQRKAREPIFFIAGSTGPRVRGVRVLYRDSSGVVHRLPVDFARTDAALLRRTRLRHPIGTFVAFIPARWAARDRLKDCLSVSDPGSDAGFRRQERRCAGRPGGFPKSAPVEAVGLGEGGQEIGRWRERPFRLARPPRFQREGEKRRPVKHPGAASRTVLIRGRAPDGNRYEWVVERFRNRSGKLFSSCETLTWPYLKAAGASGFCGPGTPPPASALSRRYAAKPFGFLDSARPASRYLVLRGYARGRVRRVKVTYPVPGGGRNVAPVNFARVHGDPQKRIGARRPFGFFIAFLPPEVKRRFYTGPADRLSSKRAVEVSAFDGRGRRISLGRHDN